jgi:hypothetical protein
MSPARTARISSLAPLLISMLSASSLALTSGAASACLMSASILPTIDFGVPAGANAPIQVATSALDEWSAHLLAAAEVRLPVGKVLPFSLAGSGRDVAKAVRCWASGFGHFFARSRTRSRPIVPSNRLLPLRPLARLAQVQGPRRAGSEA